MGDLNCITKEGEEDLEVSSLRGYLKECFTEEFERTAVVELALVEIAGRAYTAREQSGLTTREIGKRMGLGGTSVVHSIVDYAELHNVTLSEMVLFGRACGLDLQVTFAEVNNGVSR